MRGFQSGPDLPSPFEPRPWLAFIALATVAVLLMCFPAVAGISDGPDPVGPIRAKDQRVRVVVMAPTAAESGTVSVVEVATAEACPVEFEAGASACVYELPDTACDDSTDCDRTLRETCRLLGGRVTATTFSSRKKTCSGECSTGHAVSVVCVTP